MIEQESGDLLLTGKDLLQYDVKSIKRRNEFEDHVVLNAHCPIKETSLRILRVLEPLGMRSGANFISNGWAV